MNDSRHVAILNRTDQATSTADVNSRWTAHRCIGEPISEGSAGAATERVFGHICGLRKRYIDIPEPFVPTLGDGF